MINRPAENASDGLLAKLSVILLTLTTMGADVREAFAQIIALKERERRALITDLDDEDFPTREKAHGALHRQITPGPKGDPDIGTLKELRLIAKKDPRAQKTELEAFKRAEALVQDVYDKMMAESRGKKTKYPYTPRFIPATNTRLPSTLTPWGPKNDVWAFMQPMMVERLGQSFFMNMEDTDLRKSRTASLDFYDMHEQGSFDDALNALEFRKAMTSFGRERNQWWNTLIRAEEDDRKKRGWPPALEKPLQP